MLTLHKRINVVMVLIASIVLLHFLGSCVSIHGKPNGSVNETALLIIHIDTIHGIDVSSKLIIEFIENHGIILVKFNERASFLENLNYSKIILLYEIKKTFNNEELKQLHNWIKKGGVFINFSRKFKGLKTRREGRGFLIELGDLNFLPKALERVKDNLVIMSRGRVSITFKARSEEGYPYPFSGLFISKIPARYSEIAGGRNNTFTVSLVDYGSIILVKLNLTAKVVRPYVTEVSLIIYRNDFGLRLKPDYPEYIWIKSYILNVSRFYLDLKELSIVGWEPVYDNATNFLPGELALKIRLLRNGRQVDSTIVHVTDVNFRRSLLVKGLAKGTIDFYAVEPSGRLRLNLKPGLYKVTAVNLIMPSLLYQSLLYDHYYIVVERNSTFTVRPLEATLVEVISKSRAELDLKIPRSKVFKYRYELFGARVTLFHIISSAKMKKQVKVCLLSGRGAEEVLLRMGSANIIKLYEFPEKRTVRIIDYKSRPFKRPIFFCLIFKQKPLLLMSENGVLKLPFDPRNEKIAILLASYGYYGNPLFTFVSRYPSIHYSILEGRLGVIKVFTVLIYGRDLAVIRWTDNPYANFSMGLPLPIAAQYLKSSYGRQCLLFVTVSIGLTLRPIQTRYEEGEISINFTDNYQIQVVHVPRLFILPERDVKEVVEHWLLLKRTGLGLKNIGFSVEGMLREREELIDKVFAGGLDPEVSFAIMSLKFRVRELQRVLKVLHNWAIISLVYTLIFILLASWMLGLLILEGTGRRILALTFSLTLLMTFIYLAREHLFLFIKALRYLPESDLFKDIVSPLVIITLLVLFAKKRLGSVTLREFVYMIFKFASYFACKHRLRTILTMITIVLVSSSLFLLMGLEVEVAPAKPLFARKTANTVVSVIVPYTSPVELTGFKQYFENLTGGKVFFRYEIQVFHSPYTELYAISSEGISVEIGAIVYIDPLLEPKFTQIDKILIKGSLREGGVLISSRLAQVLRVVPGDTITLARSLSMTRTTSIHRDIKVVGVFDESKLKQLQDVDGKHFLPEDLRYQAESVVIVTKLEIRRVSKIVILGCSDVEGAAKIIAEKTGLVAATNLGGIVVYYGISEDILFLNSEALTLTLLVSVLVVALTSGSLYEKRREFRVLAVLGLSPSHLQFMVLGEVLLYWALGGALGLLISHLFTELGLLGPVNPIWILEALFIILIASLIPSLIVARKSSVQPTPGIPLRYALRRAVPLDEMKGFKYEVEVPVTLHEDELSEYFSFLKKSIQMRFPKVAVGRRSTMNVERIGEEIVFKLKVEDDDLRAEVETWIVHKKLGGRYHLTIKVRWPEVVLNPACYRALTEEVVDLLRKSIIEWRAKGRG